MAFIREANPCDGQGIWRLARSIPTLDDNSFYAYDLITRTRALLCSVAVDGSDIVGFATGVHDSGTFQDTLFVWQIGVAPSLRRDGIGGELLRVLFHAGGQRRPDRILASTRPDNTAALALFASFARSLGNAPIDTTRVWLVAEDIPDELDQADEVLVRIGPHHIQRSHF